jgi:hypothetical protein
LIAVIVGLGSIAAVMASATWPCDLAATTEASSPVPTLAPAVHQQILASIGQRSVDLLLLGDSQVQNWPMDQWQGLDVLNAGINGERTQHLLWRLSAPEWRNLRPANVLIQVGGNNFWDGDSLCTIASGLSALAAKAHALWPAAHIVYLSVAPRLGRVSLRSRVLRPALNLYVRSSIMPDTIDSDAALRCDRDDCGYYEADHAHFSERGHAVLTAAIKAQVFAGR